MDNQGVFRDVRHWTRWERIREQLGQQSERSIGLRLVDRHQAKGYYRFINGDHVSPVQLSRANQIKGLAQASADGGLILAIQDTTELDYSKKRSASNLGPMEYKFRRGMYLHNQILLSESGVPLGIFSQRFIVRDMKGFGKRKSRKYAPIEQKESYRWLEGYRDLESAFASNKDQTVLCICDREADIHELLQSREQPHVHYLIRSRTDRRLNDSEDKLYEQVGDAPLGFSYSLELPAKKGIAARQAELEVRYSQATIRPGYRPPSQNQLEPVALYIIEVEERNPPEGTKPICWRLLTSMEVLDENQARQIIQYYTRRWVIERFHYVLKQGFKVESRQIESPQALQNAIILDSWPAIQICALHYHALNHPDHPVQQTGIAPQYVDLAATFLTQKYKIKYLPENRYSADGAIRIIAILGGFQAQKDRKPGMISIWRGWKRLELLIEFQQINLDVGYG